MGCVISQDELILRRVEWKRNGKRVVLMVDRYELAKKGRVAVIDLGTPTGVDNVDAYRMISESFKWR